MLKEVMAINHHAGHEKTKPNKANIELHRNVISGIALDWPAGLRLEYRHESVSVKV